jgi:hypothetical protein
MDIFKIRSLITSSLRWSDPRTGQIDQFDSLRSSCFLVFVSANLASGAIFLGRILRLIGTPLTEVVVDVDYRHSRGSSPRFQASQLWRDRQGHRSLRYRWILSSRRFQSRGTKYRNQLVVAFANLSHPRASYCCPPRFHRYR